MCGGRGWGEAGRAILRGEEVLDEVMGDCWSDGRGELNVGADLRTCSEMGDLRIGRDADPVERVLVLNVEIIGRGPWLDLTAILVSLSFRGD